MCNAYSGCTFNNDFKWFLCAHTYILRGSEFFGAIWNDFDHNLVPSFDLFSPFVFLTLTSVRDHVKYAIFGASLFQGSHLRISFESRCIIHWWWWWWKQTMPHTLQSMTFDTSIVRSMFRFVENKFFLHRLKKIVRMWWLGWVNL